MGKRLGGLIGSVLCAVCLLLCGDIVLGQTNAGGTVTLNFDQVDIRILAKLVAERTGRHFVIDEAVKGTVTIVSPPVPVSELYGLFLTLLESAGCTLIEKEGVCRILPLASADIRSATVVGPGEATVGRGLVTKVLRLKHVPVEQVRAVLNPAVAGGRVGGIAAVEQSNHLVITDTAENVRRIERIVQEVDSGGPGRITELVSLQFAEAGEMAASLSRAMEERATRGGELLKRLPPAPGGEGDGDPSTVGAVVVAAPHCNGLLLAGTSAQVASLRELIRRMDVDVPAGRGRLNAIFLKFLDAEAAAKMINGLFAKSATQPGGPTAGRSIAMEPSKANNALVVDSSPGDFEVLRKLIDQLDHPPEQVHIEVLIAEMSASDDFGLGVQMASVATPSGDGKTVVQGSSMPAGSADKLMDVIQSGVFPQGLTIGVAQGTKVDAAGKIVTGYPGILNIDAMRKKGRLNILSETSLETQDNKEASVRIVDEIPILKSKIEGGSGTARDVIQNIERVDVGIKLRLTPHVIPGDEVQMVLNPSIEAVIDRGSEGSYTPTIAKREVTTTVTVPDGKTIVIAGLTRGDSSKSKGGIPILSSIPLIGWLFGHTSEAERKTNLLILVTPHVVTQRARAERLMQDWQDKTGLGPGHAEPKP